ncbi:DUF1681 domain-containing protein [Chloropicon primus]|uniref:DUF1681 domain-containing protein n=2 Tax=Chloropicon primus TaxID=1764295 RepID=A0A5B8MN63_9CHLO|nr:DUF1681 domain-containing protein [Chloropicon primus]UPR00694.1 DUF1681 domain-containing protein [Chloropicon primus]|eukprot:QDZ21484.1 DUF1681 domain-containing protein [Chloropicon primus]
MASVCLFTCRECYVYQIPPTSSASGHRANDWNVDKWLKEVSLKVKSEGEKCVISLYDMETEELFAECPLPAKPENFLTSVEPVVDSSRYFVLKIVDPQSKRHAFIGLGFRERTQSSDFNAAIDEHRQYLRRKKEADAYKEKFAQSTEAQKDYSLKEGEKITIQIKKSPGASPSKLKSRLSVGDGRAKPVITGGGLLAPPPPVAAAQKKPPAPAAAAQGDWVADFDSFEAAPAAPEVAKASNAGGEGFEDDQWGDFEG